MSGLTNWISKTIDDTTKPDDIPARIGVSVTNVEPYTNACASIASLISSPIPSSLFGVHIRLVADHVRNNAPKRWRRVNRGLVGEPQR